ncbi:hemolysin XhlA family protein [Bacillus cereus]|uniref:hemolysin XhlA family protein n=1 Tax=Bacillus cereus TaxID=1396 RepID=UPI000BF8F9ED|nr:hemolysin XhlA family protein [Bacillus cereus]PFV32837.1 peptidase [Bacillus cereus]PGQ06763.1 peptidase [Bacillus cereus]PGS45529.1 peptidase [Bacillus cereus]PGU86818.1 peptidase [Bacillus cereus]
MDEQRKHDDMKELLVGLTRVETKLDTLGNVKEVAIEAQQSAKSAHMRIDRLDKLVFWLGTTVVGAVIVGAITALFKFAGR